MDIQENIMGLELKAEEKSINTLFSGDKNQYIIPPYQRPYSWDEEQCEELLNDLFKAFEDENTHNYFLGNIVIASSLEDKKRLEVIDGQQRLTTLTLLLKALLFFDDNNKKLKSSIWELDDRTDAVKEQRLETMVFEDKDSKFLKEALALSLDNDCKITKKYNQFKKNICYFYNQLKDKQEKTLQNFADFLLYDVSILPIQTQGNNKDIARENALKIFETINDRGLPLSDSDIFKAKLFAMALNETKSDDFIKEWKRLDAACNEIDTTIDYLFKIYTHIIRGEAKIKTTEVGLRDFFTTNEKSPFKQYKNEDSDKQKTKKDYSKTYSQILADIFKIIACISFYNDVIKEPQKYISLSKWFQILKEHRNKYPLTALFVYLYKNGTEDNQELANFSKNLVRLAYDRSMKSQLQFQIYDLIIKITEDTLGDYSSSKVKKSDFEYFGVLKNGYALLAFYLQENQEVISNYKFDKIISSKDSENLDESWKGITFNDYTDSLGNMLVIDGIKRRNVTLNEKIDSLKQSSLQEIQALVPKLENWSYANYQERETTLRERLLSFFGNPHAH